MSEELPKSEEYLENGVVSSGVPMVLSHLYVIMGNSFPQQTQIHDPRGLTHSVAKILRLLDDLGTAKVLKIKQLNFRTYENKLINF